MNCKNCRFIKPEEAHTKLKKSLANRDFLGAVLEKGTHCYDLQLSGDPIVACEVLINYLCHQVLPAQAESFALESLLELKNLYPWTFSTDAASLEEQLRQEARIVIKGWQELFTIADQGPLLVILNEKTPSDYFTAALPEGAVIFQSNTDLQAVPILLYTGLKISSSEHRTRLEDSSEGQELIQAVAIAQHQQRQVVLLDFSRRRFPRSFLRVARFVQTMGWGLEPRGKLLDTDKKIWNPLPEPKSYRGFQRLKGNPSIILVDPWPISDTKVITELKAHERNLFCGSPPTKPWQDDRLGCRIEFEADLGGHYRPTTQAFVLPTAGGWMYADELFKYHLARLLNLSTLNFLFK